jgi:colicin import membrane protein
MPKETNVDQAQLELQLKVWKDLAISKQMMMRSAAEALKLDPNCSAEDLKQALDQTLNKIADADDSVAKAKEQARQAQFGLEKETAARQRAETIAQQATADMKALQETTSQTLASERTAIAKEVQKLKERVAEKEKQMKAINTALADTPENVLRKMNALKKEKQTEADARRQVEESLGKLRTEKRKQDEELAALRKDSAKLITQYKELHELATKLQEQLKPHVADEKDLPKVGELDTTLIEAIENSGKPEDETKKEEEGGKNRNGLRAVGGSGPRRAAG